LYLFLVSKGKRINRQTPDFVLRNSLDDLIRYYMWGVKNEEKIVTFTKDYAGGHELADLDIPNVLLNFVGGQTGHSNGIMH